ncbi:hypothetical protein BD779DRAFT_1611593 [Infundibulicybe gibba]|nr:hypothetical protein BD779DRAFT_1611593 [Infundibulicybe gibba]
MSPVVSGSTFVRPHLNLGYGQDRPGGVNTLPELIEFAAQHNPDHIFGLQTRPGEDAAACEITFAQLQLAVERASAWLVSTGSTMGRVRREQATPPVAILLGSDISIFVYMAALLRIGTPVSLIFVSNCTLSYTIQVLILSARLTPVAIAHLLKKTSPTAMLETLALLRSDAESLVVPKFLDALSFEEFIIPKNPLFDGLELPLKYTEHLYGDLDAIILHSSGTTGLPKPIFHAHEYVLSYAGCHRLPEQREPFRFNVSTLPLYHGFGLLAPMLSLSIGLPFVLPPASVIPTGKSTLSAIRASGARSMLSVPSIVEDILRLPGDIGLDALRDLEFLAIGGAAMKESVGSELVAAGQHLSLIGQAPGWKEPYVVQDLLVSNPRDGKQFKILGRADDLLVLATGEKVRPANMERAVAEHPHVKDVLAFGDGQLSLGLLIELAGETADIDLKSSEDVTVLVESIEPYLERGNSFTDKHGKITKEMLVFTQETVKPLIRTDKGSLARKFNYAAFDAEIKACYDRADILKAVPFPLPTANDGSTLLDHIRSLVQDITGIDDFREGDTTDFFEAGMDSLQASRLRRAILNGLRVTSNLPKPVEDLEPDFCFENSSIAKLNSAISQVMSGTYLNGVLDETKEIRRVRAMEAMVEKYRVELVGYGDIAARARRGRGQHKTFPEGGAVVLLTGSTGSLGCFLLAKLANDPLVSKVVCLNRRAGSSDIRQRQMELMSKRGATMSSEAWNKVILHEAEMSQFDFGLTDAEHSELLHVTHIIHNAWPVNFNRNLSSFEPHVKALVNLIRLAILASGTRPVDSEPTRILFASSIAVVGRFPILNPNGPLEVPESALDAVNSAEFGYPEAKWVCERVLMAATTLYGDASPDHEGPLIKGSNVRIGQMTGPEGSGAWNESEHFPIIVRTAQSLKAVPILDGSLSWIPVNRAGDVITELLFSNGFKPFYHMENPSRQSWSGLLNDLASILGGSPSTPVPLIPFSDWLDRVRNLGDDPARNPAFKVLAFLENDFVRMAAGTVILRTATARLDSPTMVRSTSLDKQHLEEYIGYWKRVGVMQ